MGPTQATRYLRQEGRGRHVGEERGGERRGEERRGEEGLVSWMYKCVQVRVRKKEKQQKGVGEVDFLSTKDGSDTLPTSD